MFKRGGSSYEAQGTGITSPYDTPRKNYQTGSWGEWEEQTRKLTQDPRGDWSYAAQGFSELGNPYKDDGSAKTIGEMLYAGAAGVRGSREKASDLEKKGELAILESQGGRMLTEEERAWKEEQTTKKQAHEIELAKEKSNEYLKMTPLPRLIADAKKIILSTATPHSFEYQKASNLAKGQAIRDKKLAYNQIVGVIEEWKDLDPPNNKWDYIATNMLADRPWYDPLRDVWHVFDAASDGYVRGEPIKSFSTVDEALYFLNEGKTDDSNVNVPKEDPNKIKLVDKNGQPVVKKGKTQKEMEKSVIEKTAEIKERFKWQGDITQGVNPYKPEETLVTDFDVTEKIYNKGGRVGYATGDAVDPLDDLKAWWNEQAWNNEG